ncbi:hypothetical protein C8034_v009526 [Colletotrichum sidae]|uniref:Uncharacterized protein n=1 Tax=Colletotrichum sidae TaxID=1347389 RepID=A0A4R8TLB7_9PEZI|nr:hypothetical protein C8034_v009526 [Colletotrichum sidae]
MFILGDEYALRRTSSIDPSEERIDRAREELAIGSGRSLDLPGRNRNRRYDSSQEAAVQIDYPVDSGTEKHPSLSKAQQDECYYLVDQITATVARIAIGIQRSSYWHVGVVACLSMLSTKLKTLIAKPPATIDAYLSATLSDFRSESHIVVDDVAEYCNHYMSMRTEVPDQTTQSSNTSPVRFSASLGNGKGDDVYGFEIKTIIDLVTIMVPLVLASPALGFGFSASLKTMIKKWRFEPQSITIDCPVYVGLVFGSTVLLVTGGFLCAFLVGERVPGVDPFNFTLFSWIVAGFVLLAAKTYLVADWAWRDFLLLRVTCRTVQEVATVARMDPQEILTVLLSSEFTNPMDTCGPYQGVFGHMPVRDGFAIDVKTDYKTLLNSGILPVKVSTLEGPAVFLLRLVPGQPAQSLIGSRGKSFEAKVCLDPPRSNAELDASFSQKDISCVKAFGIYNLERVKFC